MPRDDIGILASKLCDALARAETAEKEVARLQRIIDSRPAINAGLPATYIEWSQNIYVIEKNQAANANN